MNEFPFVSIIIPVKAINYYIYEAMQAYEKLDYPNYEIIIFPDHESHESFPNTRIIPSGPIGPAQKRDLAIEHANGEILAFIDDDAYPEPDWLKKAVSIFLTDSNVAAVGGPAMTPENDSFWQKASGAVFESVLGGGPHTYRYIPGKKMEIDDFPSVNLLVRADVFKQLNGFDCQYYPGEDTKLCLEIVYKLKKKIIYSPDVRIWHHRRSLLIPHLKQITNYAIHRGHFVRKFPKTSLRINYFLPSFLTMGTLIGVMGFPFYPFPIKVLFLFAMLIYFLMLSYTGTQQKNVAMGLTVPLAISITHFSYGLFFVWGLFQKDLTR